jgi:hypothetical protein
VADNRDFNPPLMIDSLITDTTHVISGLQTGTSYSWRVFAEADGIFGVISEEFLFATTSGPAISLSHVDFGLVAVGDSATWTVYLFNPSTDSIGVQSPALTRPEFRVGDNIHGIKAGDSLGLTFSFKPSSFDTFTDSCVVRTTIGDVMLRLSGFSPAPVLSVPTTRYDLGDVALSETAYVFITVRNSGPVNRLKVEGILHKPTVPFFFTRSTPWEIPPGDSTQFSFGFVVGTDGYGTYTDTMLIASNGGYAVLSFAAQSPRPGLTSSVTGHAFGSTTRDSVTLTLRNPSINSLRIDSIYTSTRWFQLPEGRIFPLTLRQRDSLLVKVLFAPDTIRSFKDTLFVVSNADVNAGSVSLTIELTGTGTSATAIEPSATLPTKFSLDQNYPNPFNPSTTIRYGLPTAARVRLEIYNILGQRVGLLVDQDENPGYHAIIWNATVPSGLYFCRIEATERGSAAPSYVGVTRMLLLK